MNQIPDEITTTVVKFAEMIQHIASPTFSEQPRAQFMQNQFIQLGLNNVHQDVVGNVYGKLPGGNAAPLVISAHMDSVFPVETPLTLHRTKQQFTGPGIGDNALGLAGLLGLAKHLISDNLHLPGEIWFIGNVGEEGLGNLLGMNQIVKEFKNLPIAYLALEGIGLGYIQNRALGIHRIRVDVKTQGGHSWIDYGAPSAIHEIAKIATNLSVIKLPETPRTTLNIGTIHGGDSINTIASTAGMEIDVRSEDPETLLAVIGIVKKIIHQGQPAGVQVNIIDIGFRPSGSLPKEDHLIQTAQMALRQSGITPTLVISSTDASLPISLGYSATSLGITTGKNIHSIDETIDLDPIQKGLDQILYLINHIWPT